MEPSFNICLLQPNTELVVSPKSRSPNVKNHIHEPMQSSHNKTASTGTTSPKANGALPATNCNSGFQPMNNNVVDSPTCFQNSTEQDDHSGEQNGFLSYLKSFWWQTADKTEFPEKPKVHEKLLSREFCTSFRVLPLEDFVEMKTKGDFLSGSYEQNGLDLPLQPSNVFVTEESIFSISSLSTLEHFPETFLAQISKLPSPAEKKEASKSKARLKYSDELTLKTADKVNQISGNEETEEASYTDLITVRVVVLKSGNFCCSLRGRIDFVGQKTVPLDHVLIHSELRRMLGVERTSRIQMDALMKCNDIIPDEINLYRLFQMVNLLLCLM